MNLPSLTAATTESNEPMQDARPMISVRELLAGEVKLASPPELFLQLSELLDSPHYNLNEVTRLIEHDPGLTTRLLKIVNSSFYGFPARIATVAKAITMLGINELRDLVLATLVVDRFSSMPNGIMTLRQFWAMSVRCALITRSLAARHPEEKRLQSVFICGLLHEIGRLVVYYRVPELARAALLMSRREQLPEHAAQQRVIGLDHYQVGTELARRWRLPEVIVVTIEHHDRPTQSEWFQRECLLVAIASRLSRPGETEQIDTAYWQGLDMSSGITDEVLFEANAAFTEVFGQIYAS